MKLPSEKTLRELMKTIAPSSANYYAKRIRILMEYQNEFSTLADKWKGEDILREVERNMPFWHGVAYVASEKDSMYDAYGFYYLNAGDTYATTLIWDCKQCRFVDSSWGDWVEIQERQGRKFQ